MEHHHHTTERDNPWVTFQIPTESNNNPLMLNHPIPLIPHHTLSSITNRTNSISAMMRMLTRHIKTQHVSTTIQISFSKFKFHPEAINTTPHHSKTQPSKYWINHRYSLTASITHHLMVKRIFKKLIKLNSKQRCARTG